MIVVLVIFVIVVDVESVGRVIFVVILVAVGNCGYLDCGCRGFCFVIVIAVVIVLL